VKFPHHHFRAAGFLLFLSAVLSCSIYRYSPVRIAREVDFPYRYKASSLPGKTSSPRLKESITVKKKRFFTRMVSFSPVAHLNNRAVDLAVTGKFREASVLFTEVLREGETPAAMNNIGIIYEIFRDREKAFEMYSRACIIEPHNGKFRYNMLSFLETDGHEKKVKKNGDVNKK